MTKHFDHDGSDPLDTPLAGMLTEAMASRHHQLRTSQGSINDVRMRARRITRRRTAVGAGALVALGTVGAVAVASRNGGGGGGGQRIVAGGNGGPNDAAAGPGGGGGYWECTGPLGMTGLGVDYEELLGLSGITTTLPGPPPTTTEFFSDTTSTLPFYATTTIIPDENPATSTSFRETATTATYPGATTIPFDPTFTTIYLAASTSTVDPGLSTATSFLPSVPVPSRDGVYYMQDCTYVDGSFAVDTAATTDTYPAVLDPQTAPPTTADTDVDVTDTTSPAVDLTAPPTVADTEFDVTDTTFVATTSPGG